MNKNLAGIALSLFLAVGCAKQSPSQTEQDTFEPFNRSMFAVNIHFMDPYIVRPMALVWRDYIPSPARNGLRNFMGNLSEPADMINSMLRGDVYVGMKHFTRFFLNSLLGMGGMLDVASMANPEQLAKIPPRGFGKTLANYGVGYGPYLVLPGYGSFTLREDLGARVDEFYPPLSLLTGWMSAGKWLVEGLDRRAMSLEFDSQIAQLADPYATHRELYFKRHDVTNPATITETNLMSESPRGEQHKEKSN